MPPHRPYVPPAAKPSREIFDPWNASSTGHQRGENHAGKSTGWRDLRTKKLQGQYQGKTRNVRDDNNAEGRQKTVLEMLVERRTAKSNISCEGVGLQRGDRGTNFFSGSFTQPTPVTTPTSLPPSNGPSDFTALSELESSQGTKPTLPKPSPYKRKIFTGMTVYINGSTMPRVSDHRLKQLLATHGARVAISLRRRSVTHVLVGTPNAGPGVGTGGGLAGGKVQKEIQRVGGCGLRYVGVEWVLDSIKVGKRLSEAAYSPMMLASRGQKSVYGVYKIMKMDVVSRGKAGPKDGMDGDKTRDSHSSGPAVPALASPVLQVARTSSKESKRPCFFSS